MNDPTRSSEIVELERSLRAVADEDTNQQAPLRVHAAVMRTWDVVQPFAPHRRRRLRTVAALVAIGSMAAALVAAVVMSRAPAETSRPDPVIARTVDRGPVVANVPSQSRGAPAETQRPRPRRPRTRDDTATSRYEPGVVLVADPIVDTSAMSIVRVRVPRTALVPLGIPLVEPNDGGSVDLEILVGEDGVARTIRRAVPVAVRQE